MKIYKFKEIRLFGGVEEFINIIVKGHASRGCASEAYETFFIIDRRTNSPRRQAMVSDILTEKTLHVIIRNRIEIQPHAVGEITELASEAINS